MAAPSEPIGSPTGPKQTGLPSRHALRQKMAARKRQKTTTRQEDFDSLVQYLQRTYPADPEYIASLLGDAFDGYNKVHGLVGGVTSTAGAHAFKYLTILQF